VTPEKRQEGWILALVIAGGLLLFAIGLRFLVEPGGAARTFGLAREGIRNELHWLVGLRDLWLAALVVAFAVYKEWRSVGLWFGFGAVVCFADAGVAAVSSGKLWPFVFHVVCGFLSVGISWMAFKLARRDSENDL
jgi:hypothetical protein